MSKMERKRVELKSATLGKVGWGGRREGFRTTIIKRFVDDSNFDQNIGRILNAYNATSRTKLTS